MDHLATTPAADAEIVIICNDNDTPRINRDRVALMRNRYTKQRHGTWVIMETRNQLKRSRERKRKK